MSFQRGFETKNQTRARTNECVAVTTRSLPPGGRRMRTPGDKAKARMARIRSIVRFIFIYTHKLITEATIVPTRFPNEVVHVFLAPLVIASIHGSLTPHIEKLFEGVHS